MTTTTPVNATDSMVTRNGLRLAVRDYGGQGQPVVLLPGAGRTLVDLTPLGRLLTRHHRVIAMDYRNHGLSGDATWLFDEVVADVKHVTDHFGFQRPAIVGHSLGGMIAAMYAIAYPDQTRAVVNLDGHGFGTADQYLGVAPELAEQRLGELKALRNQLSARPPLSRQQVDEARSVSQRESAALSMSSALAGEAFDRALATLPDGTFRTRPLPEKWHQMITEVDSLHLMAVWEQTPTPILIYNATKPDPWMLDMPAGLDWIADFMAAFRAGLNLDLMALAQRSPSLNLINIDATHALVFEQTELIAGQISEFLAAA